MSIQIEVCPIIALDDPDPDGHSVIITIESERAGTDRFRVPRKLADAEVTIDDSVEIGWSATGDHVIYATIHDRIVGPVFGDDELRRRSDAIGSEREELRQRQQAPAKAASKSKSKAKTKISKVA